MSNVNKRGVTFIKHGATSNTVNIIADDDLPDIDLVPHHSSLSQFYKSPSTSQLTTNIDKNLLCKRTTSHPQLHMIDTIKDSHSDMKNNVFNTRRSLLRRLRASDKTVSEDNNTNTMSSLDLATVPSLVLTTDSSASFPSVQRNISSDMNYVSDLFLSNNSHLIYSTDFILQHERYYL
ncbi:unnamed protein product [Adineta ricciae]|uniref:Uncharacterized protein n=1 Tax=Adineta ricciae TaxID=249248 RepID=A0A813Y2F6_ADIRI|nr:unnamed protein product [Adineta ricciae]